MRLIAFILLILGLLATGVLGTETRTLFFWPGCLLLGLAGVIAGLRWRMRIHFAPADACLATVLIAGLYLLGRALLSPVAMYAREDVVILLGAFVTYVLTATVASHPRWRLVLIATLLLLAVGNLAVGMIHFGGNWGFHVVPHFVRSFEPGRIGGFFNNPNHLAAFLSFVLFLSGGLVCFGRGGASLKLVLGFIGIACCIGMALTKSRGALVGLGAGGAVFATAGLWVMWRTQRHIFGRLLTGVLLLAGLVGAIVFIVNREAQTQRSMQTVAEQDMRLQIWPMALQQHAMQPLTGVGARMFYDYSVTLRSPGLPAYSGDPLFAHNEYLQALADYGWVGLALVLLTAGVHAMHGVRFLRWFIAEKYIHTTSLLSNTLGLAIGGLAALAATLAHAGFEFHFHVAATAMTGALVLGLLANPGFDAGTAPAKRLPMVRPLVKAGLVVASLALVAGAIWYGPADWWSAQSVLAQKREDMQARMALLDKVVARDPANAEALYQRALARLDQWRPGLPASVEQRLLGNAAQDLEQAAAINPQHFLYQTALVDVYDRLRREADALRVAQSAIKVAPWHEESRLALALHLHRWGHFAEAEQAYLWAKDARQHNREGELNWISAYRQMLEDVSTAGGQGSPLRSRRRTRMLRRHARHRGRSCALIF